VDLAFVPSRRARAALSALAVVALLFSACSAQAPSAPAGTAGSAATATPGAPTAEPTAQAPDKITIMQSSDIATFDPVKLSTSANFTVMSQMFDPLMQFDKDLKLIPGIALSATITDNPLVWRLKIRPDVKAHNGEAIDASDVAWTFEHAYDDNAKPTGMAYTKRNTNFDKAVVIDPLTVDVYTVAPNPVLPFFLTRWMVLPKDYYSSISEEDAALKPVGTGPYKLTDYVKGDHITMDAFDGYWGAQPKIKELIWKAVPELSARVAALNTGAADLVNNVSPDQFSQIDTNVAKVISLRGATKIYVGVNFNENSDPAVKDVNVRQALSYGMDFQKILDSVLGPGVAQRSGSFIVPPGGDPNVKPYPYDPKKALELLKASGYEDRNGDGFVDRPDGSRLELTLDYTEGRYIAAPDLALALAADWQKTGIYVEAVKQDDSVFAGLAVARKITDDLYLWGSGFSQTPQGDPSQFNSTSSDYGSYKNDEFEQTWTELSQTFDQAKRQELTYKIDNLVHDDLPVLTLYLQVDNYGVSNKLNWQPSPIGWMFFGDDWVQ
jgi:peptide/nickel transport system substrate-binding protein